MRVIKREEFEGGYMDKLQHFPLHRSKKKKKHLVFLYSNLYDKILCARGGRQWPLIAFRANQDDTWGPIVYR